MHWCKLLPVFAALMLPAGARADDPPPSPLQGVWAGTIGALPVRVCLVQDGTGDIAGSYYYTSHLATIGLTAGKDGVLQEGNGDTDKPGRAAPAWRVAVKGGQLAGTWTGRERELPIALTRVPMAKSEDADSPCGSRAFFGPRLAGMGWRDMPVHFGGLAYLEHRLVPPPALGKDVDLSIIRLDGSEKGDAAINAALAKEAEPWGEDGWVACLSNALGRGWSEGEFGASQKPMLLTRRFLSVRKNFEDDCGGAHPNAGYSVATYDRASGRPVIVARWFLPSAIPPPAKDAGPYREEDPVVLSRALTRLVMAHFPRADKDCRESLDDASTYWWIGLTPRGFVFSPELPHVVEACQDDAVVPYAAVAAMLTPAGRAALRDVSARGNWNPLRRAYLGSGGGLSSLCPIGLDKMNSSNRWVVKCKAGMPIPSAASRSLGSSPTMSTRPASSRCVRIALASIPARGLRDSGSGTRYAASTAAG